MPTPRSRFALSRCCARAWDTVRTLGQLGLAVLSRRFDGPGPLKLPSLPSTTLPSLSPLPLPAVTVLRPAGSVPDALSVIQYAALATPALSPFVPLYKGLPGDRLPRQLTYGTEEGQPNDVSLFWRCRRLQALVFQVGARLC